MKPTLLSILSVLAILPALVFGQPVLPPTPSNVAADLLPPAQQRAMVTWSPLAGPWLFKIYRSDNDMAHFHLVGVTPGMMFEDRLLESSTTYYYAVAAVGIVDSTVLESPLSTPDSVTTGVIVRGPRGTIAGTVTDSLTGTPVRDVRIRLVRRTTALPLFVTVMTDSLGQYSATIDTGSYLVHAEPVLPATKLLRYMPEWFANAARPGDADPVGVQEAQTSAAAFDLARIPVPPSVSVRGRVADTSGVSIAGATVVITRPIQETSELPITLGYVPLFWREGLSLPGWGFVSGVLWSGQTDGSGNYAGAVPQGSRCMAAAWASGYVPEVADNTTNPLQADIFTVQNDTTGVDFSLAPVAPGGTIEGTVTGPQNEDVAARVILFPRPITTSVVETQALFAYTDSSGGYSITGVPPGVYSVMAVPFSGYAPVYYKAGAEGVSSWEESDSVAGGGTVTGVDIVVPAVTAAGLAEVGGQVTSDAQPVSGVVVTARAADGRVMGFGVSDENGTYTVPALTAGPATLTADQVAYLQGTGTANVPVDTYTLTGINFSLVPAVTVNVEPGPFEVPAEPYLYQNYPNPFNPVTVIRFGLPSLSHVRLTVFDLLGREVAVLADGVYQPGWHDLPFDAGRLASGAYFYRIVAQEYTATRIMMLVK